jgi:hypothetical protein
VLLFPASPGTARAPLRFQLPQQRSEDRIVAQLLVIVQVLIPQRQAEHPLPDQRPDRVFDQVRVTMIGEAFRQAINQTDRLIRSPQQQPPGIRAHRPAIKGRHHPASPHA